jgi:hypothetical protein
LRAFLSLLLLVSFLFSSDLKTEQKIYEVIIHTLLPQKEEIKVWSDDVSKEKILSSIVGVKSVSSPEEADFLLLSKEKKVQSKGIRFVTTFRLLEAKQNSVIGGFFWQKGRPNILFLRKNLQKHHIKLPKSMQEYIEDEL